MRTASTAVSGSRGYLTRPLLIAVPLLLGCHLLVLLLLPHPAFVSNLFQLCFPLLTVAVSLHQRKFGSTLVARRCWTAVACAFGIWSLAQMIFLFLLYFPENVHGSVRPDDALWVLFGLPLLLAVNITHDEADLIGWLDRAQAILFFAVLYLLVFLPSIRLDLPSTYLIQNIALLLCCLLRLPVCTPDRERRFFVRLALFLLAYASCQTIGDLLYVHGIQLGGLVDLVWTAPIAFFLLLILLDARRPETGEAPSSPLVTAVRRMQGLSVAALAFLSIGVSGLLAAHRPVLGGFFVIAAFALFALRTNARERAWQRAHCRLEETALQDALTGLGNRTLLRKSLEKRLAGKDTTTLIFADLDRFKAINDSLGHALGDELLMEIAERLRATAPPDSVICRHGGDEFVLLTNAGTGAEAQAIGEALLQALRRPFEVSGRLLRCSASLGVVVARPGECADDLLRSADCAMYRAKQLGKDRAQIFDSSLSTQMSSRWQLEADLRDSLERGALEIAFQPILCVQGGEITGFEALARWSHPVHGEIAPAEFIALAEETGLILTLGVQVLERACRQVGAWNRAWKTSYSVSVNVSPRQFADTGLIALLLTVLERTGLPPRLLRLEITETALLADENTVREMLSAARSHGIHISLDDFGTGYSSLALLLSLPVDEVKVDRSFVSNMHRDPQRRELVSTVVHLGQSLGKRLVAEGVETEQDLQELAALGCECAQGWLISRPLSADAMEAALPSIAARAARLAHTAQRAQAARRALRPVERWGKKLPMPNPALEPAS